MIKKIKKIVKWIRMIIGCPKQNSNIDDIIVKTHELLAIDQASINQECIMDQIITNQTRQSDALNNEMSDVSHALDQFIADNTTIKEIIAKDDKKYEPKTTELYNIYSVCKTMPNYHTPSDEMLQSTIDDSYLTDLLDTLDNNQLDNHTLNNPDIYDESNIDLPHCHLIECEAIDQYANQQYVSDQHANDQYDNQHVNDQSYYAAEQITIEQTIPAEYDTPDIYNTECSTQERSAAKYPNDSLAALAELTAILKGEVIEPPPKKYSPDVKFEFRRANIVLIPEHEAIYTKELTERPIYAQFQHFTQESINIRCNYCISRLDVILSRNSVYDERYIQLYKDYPICYFYTSPTGGAIYRVTKYGYIDDVAFAHVYSLEGGRKQSHRIKVKYLVKQHEWTQEQIQQIMRYMHPGLFVDPLSIYDLILNH